VIGMDIGMGGGPILGGIISDAFDFRVAYTSAGCLMLAGFVIFILYRKLKLQKTD
jgi:dipeptide/tripeptide permease